MSIHHEKLFSQGKRNDIKNELLSLENPHNTMQNETLGQFGPKLKTREKIGEEYGLSARNVSRLLRINDLVNEIKDKIDSNNIPLNAGVELSFLPVEWQKKLVASMADLGIESLNLEKAKTEG